MRSEGITNVSGINPLGTMNIQNVSSVPPVDAQTSRSGAKWRLECRADGHFHPRESSAGRAFGELLVLRTRLRACCMATRPV